MAHHNPFHITDYADDSDPQDILPHDPVRSPKSSPTPPLLHTSFATRIQSKPMTSSSLSIPKTHISIPSLPHSHQISALPTPKPSPPTPIAPPSPRVTRSQTRSQKNYGGSSTLHQPKPNLSVVLIPESPISPSCDNYSQIEDMSLLHPEDAKKTLLEFSGLSSPASPSPNVGIALAMQVYNHITGALPQWTASDPSSSGMPPDIQVSVRHLKASARQRLAIANDPPQPSRVRIEVVSFDPDLDLWGLKNIQTNDCVRSAGKTPDPRCL